MVMLISFRENKSLMEYLWGCHCTYKTQQVAITRLYFDEQAGVPLIYKQSFRHICFCENKTRSLFYEIYFSIF